MAKQAKRTRKLHASYAAAGGVNEEGSRRCRGAVGEGKEGLLSGLLVSFVLSASILWIG